MIISLMGAGLALDRSVGRRNWATTWRMLGIAMPLCMLGLTLLGMWLLGLGLAAALLVAAALAPTDPVLASEVQVGEPADEEEGTDQEDEVRFGLTSEAGLNDGLAFPFVYLAIAMSLVGTAPSAWFPEWFGVDVLWRIGMGVLLGYGTGKVLARLFFSARHDSIRLSNHSEGFVALAATFLAYGVTQMIEGYGFIAVFVCAVTIRAAERTHGYHRILHSYVEQLERLLTVVILVLLGGAIARGLLGRTSGGPRWAWRWPSWSWSVRCPAGWRWPAARPVPGNGSPFPSSASGASGPSITLPTRSARAASGTRRSGCGASSASSWRCPWCCTVPPRRRS